MCLLAASSLNLRKQCGHSFRSSASGSGMFYPETSLPCAISLLAFITILNCSDCSFHLAVLADLFGISLTFVCLGLCWISSSVFRWSAESNSLRFSPKTFWQIMTWRSSALGLKDRPHSSHFWSFSLVSYASSNPFKLYCPLVTRTWVSFSRSLKLFWFIEPYLSTLFILVLCNPCDKTGDGGGFFRTLTGPPLNTLFLSFFCCWYMFRSVLKLSRES